MKLGEKKRGRDGVREAAGREEEERQEEVETLREE